MTPVWMEAWKADGGYVRVHDDSGMDRDGFFGNKDFDCGSMPCINLKAMERDEQRAQLASAAPTAVQGLLAIEWASPGLEDHRQCPYCSGYQPSSLQQPDRMYYFNRLDHKKASEGDDVVCLIDVALTQAGLPTRADRDTARQAMEVRAAPGSVASPRAK